MKVKVKIIAIWLVSLICVMGIFAACDPKGEPSADSFDRRAMLQNYADNLIKPAFANLQARINALQTAATAFTTTTNAQNLSTLQTAWKDALIALQYTNAYNFGPAREEGTRKKLTEEMATFPVSEQKIETNIAANNTSLNDFNRDARGLLAVEYLIFNFRNDNNAILAQFTGSAPRRDYLLALTRKLKTQVDEVVTVWNGSYATEFVNNDGIAAGSSTSQLYSEFLASYEGIKNFKVGLPLGKRSTQSEIRPDLVEAYYSGLSLEMIGHNLTAVENIWYGQRQDGRAGVGFYDYLNNVEGGPALITKTEAQLAAIRTAKNALPANIPLAQQISENKAPIEAFYIELQKNVRYFKSDMVSLLGITITFVSGDGD